MSPLWEGLKGLGSGVPDYWLKVGGVLGCILLTGVVGAGLSRLLLSLTKFYFEEVSPRLMPEAGAVPAGAPSTTEAPDNVLSGICGEPGEKLGVSPKVELELTGEDLIDVIIAISSVGTAVGAATGVAELLYFLFGGK